MVGQLCRRRRGGGASARPAAVGSRAAPAPRLATRGGAALCPGAMHDLRAAHGPCTFLPPLQSHDAGPGTSCEPRKVLGRGVGGEPRGFCGVGPRGFGTAPRLGLSLWLAPSVAVSEAGVARRARAPPTLRQSLHLFLFLWPGRRLLPLPPPQCACAAILPTPSAVPCAPPVLLRGRGPMQAPSPAPRHRGASPIRVPCSR